MIFLFLSPAVFRFQSRALGVRPGQPMGRKPSDWLRLSSAAGSRWGDRDVLCLPTVSRLGLPVLRPWFIWGRSRPCPSTSAHHHLWPRPMPEQPILPRNPPVRKRGLVGCHTLRSLAAETLGGEQRSLRNHIVPRSHSWWGVRVETTTICLCK